MQKRKIVLITGGSSGIGKATAHKFYDENNIIYIIGRNEEKLKNTILEFENNKDIYYIVSDVRKPDNCETIIERIIEKEGRLDIVVNSAGVSYAGEIENMTEKIWDDTFDTNVKGTFFICQAARQYLKQNRGVIINIGSDSGLVGSKGLSVYCASKGAVVQLTKALAIELASDGIRVNAVCPTETDTPMLEKDIEEYGYKSREEYKECLKSILPQEENARFVKAEEVAEAIYFLADNRKAAAITGVCLPIDFGITAQ